ncbi:MAG: serine hydrolase [Gemmatimonadales bacterium]
MLWIGTSLLAGACTSAEANRVPEGPPPPPAVRAAPDTVLLARALARAEALSPLNAIVIRHGDSLLAEAYYRGMRADRAVNIKSASKTLLSPLVGIALRDSLLPGLDAPLSALLPEAAEHTGVTLRHLLTHTTGLETTSFQYYGPWVTSRNWIRYAVDQPRVCPPGTCMTYSTGNSHLVGVLLARAAGQTLIQYARRALFDSLDISIRPWDRDPQGFYLGGNNMHLTPRELARFGQFYLDSGRVGATQLVPMDWIEDAWGDYATSRWNGNRHGYLWWTRTIGGEQVHLAWGYGGQFLFVVPRLDLTVAVTSSLTNRPPGSGRHNQRVYDLIGCYVIPVVMEGRGCG